MVFRAALGVQCSFHGVHLRQVSLVLQYPRYAYCPYGVNDYRAKGKFYSRSGGYTPSIGDTIFFWNSADGVVGHTGIVIDVTPTEVVTIEGNATDAVRQKRYNRTNTYISRIWVQ